MIPSWCVYRLDDPDDCYHVWAHDRAAAIRTAQLEHFGLVLLARQLGAGHK